MPPVAPPLPRGEFSPVPCAVALHRHKLAWPDRDMPHVVTVGGASDMWLVLPPVRHATTIVDVAVQLRETTHMSLARTGAATLATAMASTILVALSPAPAHADTPLCVTRAEFRQVTKGMTKLRVHRIFDRRGKQVSIFTGSGVTYETRQYRPCLRFSAIQINYENRKVSGKFAYWG